MRQIGARECFVTFDPSLIQEALAHCPSCLTDAKKRHNRDITGTMMSKYTDL